MKISLVLDSGAFSAWTRKTAIDLDEYAAFIRRHCEHLDHVVNLDVIPGEFGRVPSLAEVEKSAQQGWDNLLYLENEWGIRAMPVFHQGEGFHWLKRMIDHGCEYIGLSPANDRTTEQKRMFLDRAYDVVCDEYGRPKVKTHGFGVTSIPLLWRYPWYSADSTSWILFSAYGMILVPQWGHLGPLWHLSPNSVVVSEQSVKTIAEGKHYDSFPAAYKEHICEWIARSGVTMEQARTRHDARARVNAHFFREFMRQKPDAPFQRVRGHLF